MIGKDLDKNHTQNDSTVEYRRMVLFGEINLMLKNRDYNFSSVIDLNSIFFDDLTYRPSVEGKKLESIILIIAANNPAFFKLIWSKFKHRFTAEIFTRPIEVGGLKGKSLLWILSMSAPKILDEIWNVFEDNFKHTDFLLYDNSTPMLLILASNNATFFENVWNKFRNIFEFDHLFPPNASKTYKGDSVLLHLINNRCVNLVHAIWMRFNRELTIEHFVQTLECGPLTGASLLWFIVEHPTLFIQFWNNFKNSARAHHFAAAFADGPFKGQSVLWRLVQFATSGFSKFEAYQSIIFEMLTQLEGFLTEKELNHVTVNNPISIAQLMNRRYDWPFEIFTLIVNRSIFNKKLQAARSLLDKGENLDQERLLELNDRANKAQLAGYCNAFYELGVVITKQHPLQAMEAFEKVPPTSRYYNMLDAQYIAVAYAHLIKNIKVPIGVREIGFNTIQAITCGLKLSKTNRDKLLHDIADNWLYLNNCSAGVYEMNELLPQSLLNTIDSDLTVNRCLDVIMQVLHRKQEAILSLHFQEKLILTQYRQPSLAHQSREPTKRQPIPSSSYRLT